MVCGATSSLSIIRAARAEPSRVPHTHTHSARRQCRPGKNITFMESTLYRRRAHARQFEQHPTITMPTPSCPFCLQGTSRVGDAWITLAALNVERLGGDIAGSPVNCKLMVCSHLGCEVAPQFFFIVVALPVSFRVNAMFMYIADEFHTALNHTDFPCLQNTTVHIALISHTQQSIKRRKNRLAALSNHRIARPRRSDLTELRGGLPPWICLPPVGKASNVFFF